MGPVVVCLRPVSVTLTLSSKSSAKSSSAAIVSSAPIDRRPVFNSLLKFNPLRLKSLAGASFRWIVTFAADQRNGSIIESASGAERDDSDSDPDEIFGINELALDPKLQLKLEHRMKLKLNKKIRIRRKKLIRKRMKRKKGRWPPSKMNKLKNV